jgi:excisionase family DNA binding protein
VRAPVPRVAPTAADVPPQIEAPAPPQAPQALAARPTWTVREVAQQLGISERLLWNLIRDGRVPVLRRGRRVLVRNTTVEQVLADAAHA